MRHNITFEYTAVRVHAYLTVRVHPYNCSPTLTGVQLSPVGMHYAVGVPPTAQTLNFSVEYNNFVNFCVIFRKRVMFDPKTIYFNGFMQPRGILSSSTIKRVV